MRVANILNGKAALAAVVFFSAALVVYGFSNLTAQEQDPFGEGAFGGEPGSSADPFGDENAVPEKPANQESDPFGSMPETENEAGTIVPDEGDPTDVDPFGDPVETGSEKMENGNGSILTDSNDAGLGGTDATNEAGQGNANQDSQPDGEFEKQFWNYLTANNYKNWAPAPKQDGDYYDGRSPHGVYLKMYLNRTAIASPKELPNGSVIVKENYGIDKSLKAITVMYKSSGYNPKGKDWYWVKYNPDGTVARGPAEDGSPMLAGAAKGCMDCHGGADDDDYAFFNDE